MLGKTSRQGLASLLRPRALLVWVQRGRELALLLLGVTQEPGQQRASGAGQRCGSPGTLRRRIELPACGFILQLPVAPEFPGF